MYVPRLPCQSDPIRQTDPRSRLIFCFSYLQIKGSATVEDQASHPEASHYQISIWTRGLNLSKTNAQDDVHSAYDHQE